ncbi:MAG: hypothetical protein CMJ48_07755 [Planctomycetaceae bacterium]|nr:hypothetical protein [Planctomycetaceae bacterium]
MTRTDHEYGMQDECDLIAQLEARVPDDVPAEAAVAIRSSIAAELASVTSEPATRSAGAVGPSRLIGRRTPSMGITTAALLVVCMGLNGLVAWHSDERVTTLIGDSGIEGQSEAVPVGTERLAVKRISGAALFEYNVSLIQQELNHERNEFRGTNTRGRGRTTSGSSEKDGVEETEENLDRTGAAARPGSGLQRFSQLAGEFTA